MPWVSSLLSFEMGLPVRTKNTIILKYSIYLQLLRQNFQKKGQSQKPQNKSQEKRIPKKKCPQSRYE